MILVPCPHCGPRNASEFRWLGEVRERPDPATATLAQWRHYLYMRRNVAGWSSERWFHRAGCGRYIVLERNTVTNQFGASKGTVVEASAESAEGSEDGDETRVPGGK
jgi:heterotetrameric sarcosine oxidase delta subunit